nr:protein SIEVE ELEMENT OCCLUSION B-like [Ipomoea batatas]
MDYRHPRTCTMYNLNTLSVTIHKLAMMFSELQRQLPTINIDESINMENVWVGALSLDSRDFNANFIHCIAGYIFIFKKIVLKCLSNEGLHSTAIYLLSTLSTFSWEAKLTTMLASLAIMHGEFSVKGLAHLKRSLKIIPSFDNRKLVDDSIKSILYLTKCIVDRNLQPSYNSALQHSTLPITNYWIARSVMFLLMQHILPTFL